MNAETYDEVLQMLRSEQVPIRASKYYAHAFGSWWIELATSPSVRVMWDGKDQWAIVQAATRSPWDKSLWEDRWLGRHREEQEASEIVRRTVELVRALESGTSA